MRLSTSTMFTNNANEMLNVYKAKVCCKQKLSFVQANYFALIVQIKVYSKASKMCI